MFTASRLIVAGVAAASFGGLLMSGVLTPTGSHAPGAPASSPAQPGFAWTTDRVALTADGFRLEVNDLVFGEDVWPTGIHSDPGDSDYWTLEVVWMEHEVEQRLNMYFGADDTDWWVDEIRTYDGHEQGEWVYAYGPFFKTPLGEAFEGDVRVDLLGEGRPDDPADLVPAVLSFEGLTIAVHPGTDDGPPSSTVVELSPAPDEEGDAEVGASPDPEAEACGSEGEYPTEEAARLCRALFRAFADPHAGSACRSVEDAREVVTGVLADLGVSGWSIEVAEGVRDDGCAVASFLEDDRIRIFTGLPPDVRAVLEAFRDLSLDQCLDADSAVALLTERLEELGHEDFIVRVDSMLGGPIGREDEIKAHADAGCVFYVASGAEADGTLVYYLHGG